MDSVDKLREFVDDQFSVRGQAYKQGMAIADEIEREIAEAEAFCRRVEEAARNNDELDVFGVAYMPLPVDADGVPVRIGDVMEFAYDLPQDQPIFEVSGFGAKGALFYVPRGEIRARNTTTASVVRHVKPCTLEDVLREFAGDYRRAMNAFEEGDEYGPSITELTARCADEIRELLGGDAE